MPLETEGFDAFMNDIGRMAQAMDFFEVDVYIGDGRTLVRDGNQRGFAGGLDNQPTQDSLEILLAHE